MAQPVLASLKVSTHSLPRPKTQLLLLSKPYTYNRLLITSKPPCFPLLKQSQQHHCMKYDSSYPNQQESKEMKICKGLERVVAVTNSKKLKDSKTDRNMLVAKMVGLANLFVWNRFMLCTLPWQGVVTVLFGNLSLLSYFTTKKEKDAFWVQILSVITIYVLTQRAVAEAMPFPYFAVTSAVIGAGLILNIMNYFNMLNVEIWRLWEDFITIWGLTAFPEVLWSNVISKILNNNLPAWPLCIVGSFLFAVLARKYKQLEEDIKWNGSIYSWAGTLLFMWVRATQL